MRLSLGPHSFGGVVQFSFESFRLSRSLATIQANTRLRRSDGFRNSWLASLSVLYLTE